MTMSDMKLEFQRIHEKLTICYFLHHEIQQQPTLDFQYAVSKDMTGIIKTVDVVLEDFLEGYKEKLVGSLEAYMNKGFQYRLSRISRRKKQQLRSQVNAEDNEKSQAERDQHAG